MRMNYPFPGDEAISLLRRLSEEFGCLDCIKRGLWAEFVDRSTSPSQRNLVRPTLVFVYDCRPDLFTDMDLDVLGMPQYLRRQ